MATLIRQPFAPLDAARLRSIMCTKNTQNAVLPGTGTTALLGVGTKRKACELVDTSDHENIDPAIFKRSKGSKANNRLTSSILTKVVGLAGSPAPATTRPSTGSRKMLRTKSPAAKSSPLTAPAGRSPTHGKRSGLLTRIPTTPSSPASFSLDAALKGTISGYAPRSSVRRFPRSNAAKILLGPSRCSSFAIHEDTPDQEMTNLLQHSTCILDISSDEENEAKEKKARAEGHNKENVPPAGYVCQPSPHRLHRTDDAAVQERVALGEIDASSFYAADCTEETVVIIPDDDYEVAVAEGRSPATMNMVSERDEDALRASLTEESSIDELMEKSCAPVRKVALLEPLEETEESFELWESGSAKDEAE